MNREQANRVKRVIMMTGISRRVFCHGSTIRYVTLEQGLWKGSYTKRLTFNLADKISQRCREYGVDVSPSWLITGEGELPCLFTPTPNDAILQSESDDINHLDWSDVQ